MRYTARRGRAVVLSGMRFADRNSMPGRGLLAQPAQHLVRFDLLGQFEFGDFGVADDAERQRLGEHQARGRVEALGHAEREGGPAEQALERAHQVEVADESQVAGLAEPDSDLVEGHRARRPGRPPLRMGSASEVRVRSDEDE